MPPKYKIMVGKGKNRHERKTYQMPSSKVSMSLTQAKDLIKMDKSMKPRVSKTEYERRYYNPRISKL